MEKSICSDSTADTIKHYKDLLGILSLINKLLLEVAQITFCLEITAGKNKFPTQ